MKSKRILSLVLALVMVLGTFGTVFADTAETTETVLDSKVQWLIDQEILQGNEAGDYELDSTMTRDVLARIVAVALEEEEAAQSLQGTASGFADMTPAHWANGFASYANAKGYMIGNEKSEFMPKATVNYDQALVVMVKVALDGDLTAAEKAGALTWYAPYVAKAAELGLTEGVSIANVGAPAVKADILKMLYNVLNNKDYGNYTVLKAIVLENNRVESVKENEIVVEVIKAVQKADFVTESRDDDDIKGEQYKFALADKYDVENLLGKVADFSIDKNGKVVEIKIDNTYDYLTGKVVAVSDALEINEKEYTVIKDERVSSTDDRLYRTYENNRAKKYVDFAPARKFKDTDEKKVDFAKVTVKNGKVVFIDAFDFSDIAPVKNVEKADKGEVMVYNDLRNGSEKKVDDIEMVIGFDNGTFSRMAFKDIKELNVIHVYEASNGDDYAIVRTDAKLDGKYEKVSFNRANTETLVVIDGKEYEALDTNSMRPVVSYNEKDVRTMDVKNADKDLRDFKDEKVTALLDVNSDLQYIGAEIALGEFMALVDNVLARDVRLINTSDEKVDYGINFGTKLYAYGHSQQTNLHDFGYGDLVYAITDDKDLDVMASFEGELDEREIAYDGKGFDIDKNYVNFKTADKYGVKEYRVLDRTNVFVRVYELDKNGNVTAKIDKAQGTNMKDVLADLVEQKDVKGGELTAEMLTDRQFTDNKEIRKYSREITTDRNDIAHTIVFTVNPFKNKADKKVVKLSRIYSSGRDYEVRVEYPNGSKEDFKVERDSNAYDALVDKDVVEDDVVTIELDKKTKEVRAIKTKISVDAVVFEVAEEVRYSSQSVVKLIDVNDRYSNKDYYIARDVAEFGSLDKGAKISIAVDEDIVIPVASGKIVEIEAFIVRDRGARVTGEHEYPNWSYVKDYTGIVEYVNETLLILTNGERYTLDRSSELYDAKGQIIAVGGKEIATKLAVGTELDLDEIKIRNGVVTTMKLAWILTPEEEAEWVEDMINLIPAVADLTLDDEDWVISVREDYDGLTAYQKGLVGNYAVLVAAEAKIAELKGGPVVELTATYEAKFNEVVKKYALAIILSDAAMNDKVTKIIVDGTDYQPGTVVKGMVLVAGAFDVEPTTVKVVVDGKTITATK